MRLLLIILLISLIIPAGALPIKIYIPVPFLCQAPYANWSQPWQDGCEEAAIIMAMRYVEGKGVTKADGKMEILDQVAFQRRKLGGHYDLTAAQSAQLIRDYYDHSNVIVKYDISIEDIKDELAKGNLVITPMAGRELNNPYYTPPGPSYHYMLFKGYDDRSGEFITNDPGTKRGRNYRYKYQVAFNAIHDWKTGRKVMIVVKLNPERTE
ncbi:MAG: C39 family peptidase [Candidatus Margulisiibacteriota bacterium]|nr:C39 family peptidase [Candidatus Margulisiibacteriota bacterium]